MPQISIEETQAIIDDCISRYLEGRRWLNIMDAQALSSCQSPLEYCIPCPAEAEDTQFTTGQLNHSISDPTPDVLGINTSSSSGTILPHQSPSSRLLDDEKQPLNHLSSFAHNEFVHGKITQGSYPAHHQTSSGSIIPVTTGPDYNLQEQQTSFVMDSHGISERRKCHRELAEKMFKPLEDYITAVLTTWECLNGSFIPVSLQDLKAAKDSSSTKNTELRESTSDIKLLAEGDYEKALLLNKGRRKSREKHREQEKEQGIISIKSPSIDWDAVRQWYDLILDAGSQIVEMNREETKRRSTQDKQDIQMYSEKLKEKEKVIEIPSEPEDEELELVEMVEEARLQVAKALLTATENLLKRPGRPLKEPGDIRFLLIILENPLLYPSYSRPKPFMPLSKKQEKSSSPGQHSRILATRAVSNKGSGPGQHAGIIKRIVGLISLLPNIAHHYIVSWFSRLPEPHFRRIVELGGTFVTYRLNRQTGRKNPLGGIGGRGKRGKGVVYNDDWQIRAAARFMALLFSANNSARSTKTAWFERDSALNSPSEIARRQARARGQIILTSDFYNMLLDYADLIADFDSWESRSGKFCFCQYPFLFSMGAKIHILEYDARRQMEAKARDAFFTSLTNRRAVNQYLVLKVRRDCLVEDSLKGISEGVGGMGDIKKGLRIEFVGEDGVDAGGLRKEWFLLLVRDVFDPHYGKSLLALFAPTEPRADDSTIRIVCI